MLYRQAKEKGHDFRLFESWENHPSESLKSLRFSFSLP